MQSGVYSITNKVNNKRYIGSAKNFISRWKTHLRYLRKNKHWNIKLQRSFNKYGELYFVFEIIEEFKYCKDIMIREQYWIDYYKSKKDGYNIADANFGDVLTNHPNKEVILKNRTDKMRTRINLMSKEEKINIWGRFGEINGRIGICRR